MNTKRLLLLVVLLACLLPALTVTMAQDDSVPKGETLGAGLTREEAVAVGLDTTSWFGDDEHEPYTSDIYPYVGYVIAGEIGYEGDTDHFDHIYGFDCETLAVAVAAQRFGSNLDSYLYLYGEGGDLLAENDDSWGRDSYLEYDGACGQNFDLVIRDYRDEHGGSDHWYQLYTWFKDPGCEEPNNTKGKAKAIGYTSQLTCPHIDRDGDVDWYKFEGQKGDVAQVTVMTTEIHGTVESDVKLYDGSKVLAQCNATNWGPNDTNCHLQATLPKTGTYYIMVRDAHNKGGDDKRYWLDLTFVDPYEPNNDRDHAWTIEYGQTVRSHTSSSLDWYKFYGWSGDVVTMSSPGNNLYLGLYDSDKSTQLAENYEFPQDGYLNPLTYQLTHNGWYYLFADDVDGWVDYYPGDIAYELTVGPMLLLGTTGSGKLGELTYDRSDILAYYPDSDSYALYFDGSAIGVKAQLADFEVLLSVNDDSGEPLGFVHDNVLMTFVGNVKLPELGTVKPQDVVDFWPSATGGEVYGMFLDGSDIGLTSGAESIDAVAYSKNYNWDGYLIFSTTGKATITSRTGTLTVEDEDLVACTLHSRGWNTDASCELMVDGSLAGLPKSADIASVAITSPGTFQDDLYLTFTAPVTIEGVKYLPNEIAVCRWRPDYDCDWQPKYFAGNSHGLKGKKIDGVDWPW